jgi:hypothetical protein
MYWMPFGPAIGAQAKSTFALLASTQVALTAAYRKHGDLGAAAFDLMASSQVHAARQFEPCLRRADNPELVIVLEDVESERDRRYDREIVSRAELIGRVHLLEPLVRRPDRREVQQEHEPPNIPCRRIGEFGNRVIW